ncbi:MAG TPA: hypothetical protein VN456_13975 [Desulfosporosinus sp.]|nr:hypothetical protein [Desulfosporosinus sp.]
MKKALILFVTFLIFSLSIVLTRSAGLIQTTGGNALTTHQQGKPTLLQDTPENVLNSFYENLLLKVYGTTMAPLFYQHEHYTSMVTDAFNSKVIGYKDHPVYTRQSMASSDYALYTVSYTLMFKNINDPVPFLDVLPLIKQNGKWYIFIENPTATPLEQAVRDLYNNPIFSQAEADHALQLQTLLTKYPDLAAALA